MCKLFLSGFGENNVYEQITLLGKSTWRIHAYSWHQYCNFAGFESFQNKILKGKMPAAIINVEVPAEGSTEC